MNTDSMKRYCNGHCNNMQIIMFFVIKLVFVIFWTWILNVLCRGGAGWLSWFLVLFPFIMMFAVALTMFGSALVTGGSYISSYGQQFVQPNFVQPNVVQPNVVQPNVAMPPVPHAVSNNTAMLVNGMPAPKM